MPVNKTSISSRDGTRRDESYTPLGSSLRALSGAYTYQTDGACLPAQRNIQMSKTTGFVNCVYSVLQLKNYAGISTALTR